MKLDLLITGANVITMNDARPVARSMGVWRGRIVGFDDDVEDLTAHRVIDLRGRTVIPGLIDSHSHLVWAGLAKSTPTLTGITSISAALALIADAVRRHPTGAWVDIMGYDQNAFGRHLTRQEIDAVSAGRKVLLHQASGHGHLINSLALEGITELNLPGVARDERGAPTGLFLEEAMALTSAVRNPYSIAELQAALTVAANECASQGVTAVVEAGVGGGVTCRSEHEAFVFQRAERQHQLPIRVQLMFSADLFGAGSRVLLEECGVFGRVTHPGLAQGFGSNKMSIGPVKFFLDGGLMLHTAALSEPYFEADHCGEITVVPDETESKAVELARSGWQVALHAIGDAAVDLAIDIYRAIHAEAGENATGHRLEHGGVIRPDQLSSLRELGVFVSTQPAFVPEFAARYARVLGPDRSQWLYRGSSLLDAGVRVAGGSDRPVSSGSALESIKFLIDRVGKLGERILPDEAMHPMQALAAYTCGAAEAARLDADLGSLAEGKCADFVVLREDGLRNPHLLNDALIVATVMGGKETFGSMEHQ